MHGMTDMNRRAQEFAGQAAESYRRLGEQTVGLGERNVRFLQDFFEEGVRQARRRTEENLALTQRLFEQAEEQGEVLRRLNEGVARAYWGSLFPQAGGFGGTAPRGSTRARAPQAGAVPFPIPGYAKLTSAQVIEKLDGLSVEELKKVRAYEMEHKNRKTVLAELEGRIRTGR